MANRQKNIIEPGVELHLLKHQFQKRFMGEQCLDLLPLLNDAIRRTFEVAPVRQLPYLPTRPFDPPAKEPQNPEARLERRLYRQWASGHSPAGEFWQRMACYQVNLPNSRDDTDWGEIDLLAVSASGLPVVVELKAGNSNETPAAILVQAAAYGIALKKAWTRFRAEWQQEIGRRFPGLLVSTPALLEPCELVCAAPEEYWKEWLGKRPRARAVRPGSGGALRELQDALAGRGLPSRFVNVGKAEEQPYTPRPVDLFQMR